MADKGTHATPRTNRLEYGPATRDGSTLGAIWFAEYMLSHGGVTDVERRVQNGNVAAAYRALIVAREDLDAERWVCFADAMEAGGIAVVGRFVGEAPGGVDGAEHNLLAVACVDPTAETVDFTRAVVSHAGRTPVVPVTVFESEAISRKLLEVGADACVPITGLYRDTVPRMLRSATQHAATRAVLRQREEDMALVSSAIQELTNVYDRDRIYEAMYARIATAVRHSAVFVASYDESDRTIRAAMAWQGGMPLDVSAFPPIPLQSDGKGIQSEAIRTGKPLLVNDYDARVRASTHHYYVDDKDGSIHTSIADDEERTQSGVVMPLRFREETIGVVQVLSREANAFTEQDRDTLWMIVSITAAAIANARLFEQTLSEIRERRRAEEALRESERKYRLLVENATESIAAIEKHGVIIFANEAGARMVGGTGTELVGTRVHEHLPAEMAAQLMSLVGAAMADRGRHEEELRMEFGGSERWLNVTTSPILDDSGDVVAALLIASDITERRRLEAQLRQSHKMEAVGRLAGGIAHDFNNLLAIIMGYAELLQAREDLHHEVQEFAGTIVHTSQRAGQLIEKLLTFSRRNVSQDVDVDVHAEIRDVERLLTRTVDPRIEISLELGAAAANVVGDPSQIQNAILNLAVNARDAMPDGGRIIIATRDRVLTEEECSARGFDVVAGRYVEIVVEDTGTGISDEDFGHLFEPFFTTKEVGKGTGLGLSMVYGMAKEHHGAVSVTTCQGKGSAFSVWLPVNGRAAGETESPSSDAAEKRGGTILVVEDDDVLRAVMRRMLERGGYQVVTAANGCEGVDTYLGEPERFDLVILDMVMPLMDGHTAFRRMRAGNHGLRAVACSGYRLGLDPSRLVDEGFLAVIQKPFSSDTLYRCVSECIAAARASDP